MKVRDGIVRLLWGWLFMVGVVCCVCVCVFPGVCFLSFLLRTPFPPFFSFFFFRSVVGGAFVLLFVFAVVVVVFCCVWVWWIERTRYTKVTLSFTCGR